jgi:hypothetical protein
LRILISGAGGTVGRALEPALTAAGHAVTRLVRARPRDPREFRWDPAAGTLDPAALASCDAVVHLAGASIAGGRWTRSRKAGIMESRRAGTRLLATAIGRAAAPPRVFLCGSAVGYYGDRGDELLTEESPPGGGFLAEVVRVWEGEAHAAATAGVRVVLLRLGIVLAAHAGALPRMALPFRLGLGGRLGSGRQWMSWIALPDVLGAIGHLIAHADLTGPVNLVSPGPVTNREFGRALGRVLGRPALVSAPGWALTGLLGEMGRELLLYGQRVSPARLLASGFTFGHPELEAALRHTLGREGRSD